MEVAIFAFEEDMCIAANNRDSHFYTPAWKGWNELNISVIIVYYPFPYSENMFAMNHAANIRLFLH